MRAVLRRLHSPDALDLEAYRPEDAEHFGLLIEAMIGPAEGEGEESFDFIYCSPSWLQQEVARTGPIWGRHYLFDVKYDLARLRVAVEKVCRQHTAPTWDELAEHIARYGRWEFEDYEQGGIG